MNKFFIQEFKRVKDLWGDVQVKLGIHTRLPVLVDDPILTLLQTGRFPGPNFGIGKEGLSYVPGTTEPLSDEQILGAMAHEMGHLRLGHVGVPRYDHTGEYAADRWATERGFGQGLLDLLSLFAKEFGPQEGSKIHPPIPLRIQRIQQMMAEMATRKKAA